MAIIAAAVGGCYAPELRDCTLTCSAASDCADGQVCGTDHFCAAPGIAGRCSSLPGDAGSNVRDAGTDAAMMLDARLDAAPDAMAFLQLAISIEGQGRITVQGIGTCDKSGPQNGECTYAVPAATPVTAQAQGYEDWDFDKWTTPSCAFTSSSSCTFVPSVQHDAVGAKFRRED